MTSTCPTCRAPFTSVEIERDRLDSPRRTHRIVTGEPGMVTVTCASGHRWLVREARRTANRPDEYGGLTCADAVRQR